MCGIAGLVNLDKRPIERSLLEEMVRRERHRGPDDSGFYYGAHFGLGHARLSIIDLSPDAHQPMANEDAAFYIIHNGEIYNYLELRKELEALGHCFKSKSDTEVIIHAYEEWAEGCLTRFNGMWSFAILDLKKKTLFCSRDRFGVKPFYYYTDGKVFLFASEIKALLCHPDVKREPNDRTVFNYLSSGYGYMDISDDTFFEGIKQLKPGHYIKVSIDSGRFSQARYWDLDPLRKTVVKKEEDAFRMFRDIFEDSVKLRLRSDVALGVSLSGGLDSSSIACVAARLLRSNRLETFSSCFDEKEYDERDFIDIVIDRTKAAANFVFTRAESLFDDMEEIIWYQEEPYSTLSILPQWYVMKRAKELGVKVLLSGQGGDETLGGYHKYYFYLFADLIHSFKWKEAFKEINSYRAIKGSGAAVAAPAARIIAAYMTPGFVKNVFTAMTGKKTPSYLSRDFAAGFANRAAVEKRYASILNNELYNAMKISPLPSLLHIDDRSSMAHSVESRSPFLDYRLVEYLFSLGPEYKIKNGMTKYVLREALTGTLPEEVRLRRDKMGFATPLERWFKTGLKDGVREIFTSKEFLARRYFDHRNALKKFDNFIEGKEDSCQYTIWSWVNLELWLRKFIDGR